MLDPARYLVDFARFMATKGPQEVPLSTLLGDSQVAALPPLGAVSGSRSS